MPLGDWILLRTEVRAPRCGNSPNKILSTHESRLYDVENAMAYYQVLYWQDIPSQIKTWDDMDEVRFELGAAFMDRIDRSARAQGLTSSDDYLAQWKWSDEEERDGTAQEVADALKKELENKFLK